MEKNKELNLPVISLSNYEELQSALYLLKENNLPVVIILNVVNHNQTIGDISNSTVARFNVNGSNNEFIAGYSNIIEKS
jgi:predicted transcriptional regulator